MENNNLNRHLGDPNQYPYVPAARFYLMLNGKAATKEEIAKVVEYMNVITYVYENIREASPQLRDLYNRLDPMLRAISTSIYNRFINFGGRINNWVALPAGNPPDPLRTGIVHVGPLRDRHRFHGGRFINPQTLLRQAQGPFHLPLDIRQQEQLNNLLLRIINDNPRPQLNFVRPQINLVPLVERFRERLQAAELEANQRLNEHLRAAELEANQRLNERLRASELENERLNERLQAVEQEANERLRAAEFDQRLVIFTRRKLVEMGVEFPIAISLEEAQELNIPNRLALMLMNAGVDLRLTKHLLFLVSKNKMKLAAYVSRLKPQSKPPNDYEWISEELPEDREGGPSMGSPLGGRPVAIPMSINYPRFFGQRTLNESLGLPREESYDNLAQYQAILPPPGEQSLSVFLKLSQPLDNPEFDLRDLENRMSVYERDRIRKGIPVKLENLELWQTCPQPWLLIEMQNWIRYQRLPFSFSINEILESNILKFRKTIAKDFEDRSSFQFKIQYYITNPIKRIFNGRPLLQSESQRAETCTKWVKKLQETEEGRQFFLFAKKYGAFFSVDGTKEIWAINLDLFPDGNPQAQQDGGGQPAGGQRGANLILPSVLEFASIFSQSGNNLMIDYSSFFWDILIQVSQFNPILL